MLSKDKSHRIRGKLLPERVDSNSSDTPKYRVLSWYRSTSYTYKYKHTNNSVYSWFLNLQICFTDVKNVKLCFKYKILSYITECRGPMDLIVGTDASVLCLQTEGEGGDMENEDVWGILDLPGV